MNDLALRLCCPRCGRNYYGVFASPGFRADLTCQGTGCAQAWWAMSLDRGPVRAQLETSFGASRAAELMASYRLPDTLERAEFWQVPLTRRALRLREASGQHGLPPAAVAQSAA